ncbi:uncharacterized protein KQ657_001146 [Scheffersomyces spartinae]|uniref:Protein SKT5 n=1 Tax=Scheffersomyces spartinae TaxID=45513 RepID=A0A9P8AH76_9ASCO|nr:uncharacterized protein KQ657_001146 [Scheffersomyces spartinae]KAG7193031.1 hypothetical protein KQ657_001146 [Scheffersomyces spartinae]
MSHNHPYRQLHSSPQPGVSSLTVSDTMKSEATTIKEATVATPLPYPIQEGALNTPMVPSPVGPSKLGYPHQQQPLAAPQLSPRFTTTDNHRPLQIHQTSSGSVPTFEGTTPHITESLLSASSSDSSIPPVGGHRGPTPNNNSGGYSYPPKRNGGTLSPNATGSGSGSVPYHNAAHLATSPSYGPNTPPRAFSSAGQSPPFVALSATSSVTNLNITNSANGVNGPFSKSENNLSLVASPQFNAKLGHNRSVSSASSFMYDRNDNASLVDFSQSYITQYLGDNSSNLLPRIKTLQLYQKNAKKSNDPTVLFQYAQYILQTALLLDLDSQNHPSSSTSTPPRSSLSNQLNVKAHSRSKSSNSLDLGLDTENDTQLDINEAKLKRILLKEAHKYLRRLSDKGYSEAQYLLGDAYSSGAFGKVENRDAFALFLHAAKHGHTESAYRASHCYEEGLGTGRDARKAIEFLKMAASKNHSAAMYKLGIYSFYGRMGLGNDINTKKSGIKWLTRAANVATELTSAAPYELGRIHFQGFQDIVLPDEKYALELYSQAAALGHIQAAAILGHNYEVGEIVAQDANLLIHYYTQAALGGDAESMLAMCAWYLVGSEPFLPKDESEAFEWAHRAALCQLPKAQFALGNFYEKGIGCIKNSNEAQTWYTKAAENGSEKALSRLVDKDLARKLEKRLKISSKEGSPGKDAAKDKDCVIA